MQARDLKSERRPRPLSGKLLPPQDLDAEAAVLSAVIIRPETVDELRDVLAPVHFYSHRNGLIYEAAQWCREEHGATDNVLVLARLRDLDKDKMVGGAPYLFQLTDATPSIGNVREHARVVFEKARQRSAIALHQQYAAEGYETIDSVQSYIERAELELSELGTDTTRQTLEPAGEIMARRLAELQEARDRGADTLGTPTGLKDLDEMTGGLFDGDLIVLAGRPAMGKTAAATTIAANVARPAPRGSGLGVAVFSLEMPRDQCAERFACAERRVEISRLRRNALGEEQWDELVRATDDLQRLPIWIDDTAGIALAELRARARRLQRDISLGRSAVECERLGLVVVDYLQLMAGVHEPGRSREQEVSGLSQGLKKLAKDLSVPVLALSQLNRSVETSGKDKRPQLSALRESGAIEQDADGCWFLFRPGYYDDQVRQSEVELIVRKQRNGPCGTVKLYFDGPHVAFYSATEGGYGGDNKLDNV